MKLSWVFSAVRDSLCWLANHVTLSLWLVSQRPPTDHCAMPRPGPPPICAMVGLMPDSCIRLPITPAVWTLERPLLMKKLNAVCSLLDSAASDMLVSSGWLSVAQPETAADARRQNDTWRIAVEAMAALSRHAACRCVVARNCKAAPARKRVGLSSPQTVGRSRPCDHSPAPPPSCARSFECRKPYRKYRTRPTASHTPNRIHVVSGSST